MTEATDSTKKRLRQLHLKSHEESLLSQYGQMVMLLDADESILEEAIIDASPKQLLKIISVFEDQLNLRDSMSRNDQERYRKFLYLRHFAITQFRMKLGVEEHQHILDYSPHNDHVLLNHDDLDIDLDTA